MRHTLFAPFTRALASALVLLSLPYAALASDQLVVVVVDEAGAPLTGAELSTILNGQKQPRGTTGADGTLALDLTAMNVGTGTSVRVVVVRCGEKVQVQLVPPGEKERCEDENDPRQKCECREAGFLLWGSGRLVIRVGRTGSTVTFTPAAGGASAGPRVDLTFLGAWKRTTFTNVDEAEATIAGRYESAGYNEFATDVRDSDTGFGFGAALKVMFGAVGVMGGYSYQDLGRGEVHTAGTRVLNNLAFQLDSAFDLSAHKVIVGVPIGSSRFVVIPYYGRAFWNMERTIVDELRTGGTRVAGGTTTDSADGSDNILGARVEVYATRLVGGFFEVERISFKNVFQPDGDDGLPPDVDNTNIIVGVVIRLPLRR